MTASASPAPTPSPMPSPKLGTIILYARDMRKTALFYSKHFGLTTSGEVVDGLIELQAPNGGANILIHQAAKSIKLGHAGIKLSFHVQDVESFVADAQRNGLSFGPIHQAQGYCFANTKDPDKNSVSVSSRHCRATPAAPSPRAA